MINLDVEKNSIYRELIIEGADSQMTSGLLDEKEALDIAKELIGAAEGLLPSDYNEQESALSLIRENL